jgi:hypothetical protein
LSEDTDQLVYPVPASSTVITPVKTGAISWLFPGVWTTLCLHVAAPSTETAAPSWDVSPEPGTSPATHTTPVFRSAAMWPGKNPPTPLPQFSGPMNSQSSPPSPERYTEMNEPWLMNM